MLLDFNSPRGRVSGLRLGCRLSDFSIGGVGLKEFKAWGVTLEPLNPFSATPATPCPAVSRCSPRGNPAGAQPARIPQDLVNSFLNIGCRGYGGIRG